MVGDGKTVHVYEDSWLKEKSNLKVDIVRSDNDVIVNVCEIFIPEDKRWDTQKVVNSFQSCDTKALSNIIPK